MTDDLLIDFLIATVCMSLGFFGIGFFLAAWLFRKTVILPQFSGGCPPEEEQWKGGWWDLDGTIRCVLCDWRGYANSVEHMEALIINHMQKHGLVPCSRTDMQTGAKTEFPKEAE